MDILSQCGFYIRHAFKLFRNIIMYFYICILYTTRDDTIINTTPMYCIICDALTATKSSPAINTCNAIIMLYIAT